MAFEHFGPDKEATAQPHWQHGLVELVRYPARVYSIDINGNETYHYKASHQQIQEMIDLFSKMRLRDHHVVLSSKPPQVTSFKKDTIHYNVSLHAVNGIALWYAREQYSKGTPIDLPLSPRLTLYLNPDDPAVQSLVWPKHLIIENQLGGIEIPSLHLAPERKLYHGGFKFADESPSSDFVAQMNARITLWEQGYEHGINLSTVSNKGTYFCLLSDQEMAALREGSSHLTLTLGNFLVQPARSDLRIQVNQLTLDPTTIQPASLPSPEYQWGRILFEDGSAPLLEPTPWPGARISVSFPFAGRAEPDSEGYFRLLITQDQLTQLKERKPSKNIYVPSYVEKNSSRAEHIFDPSLLNSNKS